MIYQVTHTQFNTKFLGPIAKFITSAFNSMQKSIEIVAYRRILNQYGHVLTEEQRNQVRKNIVELQTEK